MSAGVEVPQADRLDLVRRFVSAVARGATSVSEATAAAGLAPRYGGYAAQAARSLGLLTVASDGKLAASSVAKQMLSSSERSTEERQLLSDALTNSPALQKLASIVLAPSAPSRVELADMIAVGWGLSMTTALRRARTLLTWRAYLLQGGGEQLRLPGTDWDDEEPTVPLGEPTSPDGPLTPRQGPTDSTEAAEDVASAPHAVGIEPTEALQESLETLAAGSSEGKEPTRSVPDLIAPPVRPESAGPAGGPVDLDASAALGAPAPAVACPRSNEAPDLLSSNNLAYLERQLRLGNLVLFTGAGFSLGAKDIRGRPLPLGGAVATELWEHIYPGEAYDNSSLQDIFEACQRSNRKQLALYLKERFSVDSASLPSWYQTWFAMPWWKVYTLNVDDLEVAAGARFDLPREMQARSAIEGHPPSEAVDPSRHLETVHLNGIASDGPEGVTFSGEQYSTRVARQEPYYAFLAAEMLTHPFVFIGSPLDEPIFWQHLGMRSQRTPQSANELRPKCFLLSPTLGRARIERLRAYNIVHVPATAEQFAKLVLEPLKEAAEEGYRALGANAISSTDDARNIIDLATVVNAKDTRTGFLVGEEPVWSDVRHGRAVARDEDGSLFGKLGALAGARADSVNVAVVSGTAGSGKTTLLMKSALFLHSRASRVGWVGADSQVSPRTLGRFFRDNKFDILFVDDAGRYGHQLRQVLKELRQSESLKLVVLGVRSFHARAIEDIAADHVHLIGTLTDGDIDRLLGILEKENCWASFAESRRLNGVRHSGSMLHGNFS